MTAARVLTVAEMQARDLARRRLALALLVALPLSFYGSLAPHDSHAVVPGGIAMAFAVAGVAIFSVLAARRVDERLALAGFRPGELVVGRLLCLVALSVPMVGGAAALMAVVSHPSRPWLLGGGVAMVALVAVPFGLAVGALVPRELEACGCRKLIHVMRPGHIRGSARPVDQPVRPTYPLSERSAGRL